MRLEKEAAKVESSKTYPGVIEQAHKIEISSWDSRVRDKEVEKEPKCKVGNGLV